MLELNQSGFVSGKTVLTRLYERNKQEVHQAVILRLQREENERASDAL